MIREVFIIFVACLCMSTFVTIAQTKNNVIVKAEAERFATETFASVTCNQFDSQFIKTKEKVTFNDEHDLDELFSFIGKFKQIDDQGAIDVRGKITFLNHGKETTYCFDKFAVFYSNGKYFSNVPLLHFIGKKIFDDDLRYLDK